MKNIFTNEVINFISNEMKICVNDLTKKILSDVPKSSKFFNNLFEILINIRIPNEYDDNLISSNNDKNKEFINRTLYDFLESNGFKEDSDEHFIFDNIRHAFINFKQGGVLQMYQYREAEVWYPKVVIDSFLGKQEDIDELEQTVTVYRGTSIDEYKSGRFGQSWTISKKIAEDFAFVHYSSQQDYRNQERVVIKSEISKNIILHYDKNGRENEVILDCSKINKPIIIVSKILD